MHRINHVAIDAKEAEETRAYGPEVAAELAAARRSGNLAKVIHLQRRIGEGIAEGQKAQAAGPRKRGVGGSVKDLSTEQFDRLAMAVWERQQSEEIGELTPEDEAYVYADEVSA